MVSNDTSAMMEAVYEIAVDEFGRKWVERHVDDEVVVMHLDGGHYPAVVQFPQEGCVLITNTIESPDPNLPGLSDAMLREHSCWVMGRVQRIDDTLMVAHTVFHSEIQENFAAAARTVHTMACRVEAFLMAACATDDASE